MTEVLVATTLVAILLVVAIPMNLQQLSISEELRRRAALTRGSTEAALAMQHIARTLEAADQVVVTTSGKLTTVDDYLQVRRPLLGTELATVGCRGRAPDPLVPPASCLDDPLNYRWDQYRRDTGTRTLQVYSDTRDPVTGSRRCTTTRTLAHDIDRFEGYYGEDSAPPPPGGEPFDTLPNANENNVLHVRVDWSNGLPPADPRFRSLHFVGEAVPRNIGYTDVGAENVGHPDVGSSGIGLDVLVVSPPPPVCP